MKKGFTLIELLAVIVILAIIALIATPIVLSIIEDTKESALLRSAEHYLNTVELGVAKKNLTAGGSFSPNKCIVQEDGNLLCDGTEVLEVEVSGEVPTGGTITFEEGKILEVSLTLSNKEIWTDPFTGELAYKLAPGLYDENDNLIASWEELVEEHDLKTLIEADYSWEGNNAADIINNIDGARKLVIDDSVTVIGLNALNGCSSLTSIIIPDSVTSIGMFAFDGCSSLESITIPSSVTSVGMSAFFGCTGLTNVTLGSGVTSIENGAFANCSSLKSITIPDSVTSISNQAFDGCSSLTTINYKGSETQWNAITKDGWDYNTPDKIIYYNYTG